MEDDTKQAGRDAIKKHFGTEQSNNSKLKNIQKHLRIADATTGHIRDVHLKKAELLSKKYGIKFESEK